MSLPPTNSIEMPILQELAATGGTDDVHFLYERLIGYFPQIEDREIQEIKRGESRVWRKAVQKAGRSLDEKNFIKRHRGLWTITARGRETAQRETSSFTLVAPVLEPMTHSGERHALRRFAHRTRSQNDVEFAREQASVFVKRFVKIAETKKQQRIFMLGFDFEILPPNRGFVIHNKSC